MTDIYVGYDGTGHRAYRSELGITREWVGPRFDKPRDAIDYAATLRGVPSVQATRAGHTPAGDSDSSATAADGLLGSSGPVIDVSVDLPPSRSDDPLSLGLL